jgi:hypothetical protein
VFAELISPIAPTDLTQLKFSTKFADAKNPDEYQDKFSMMLSLQELRGLASMISAHTAHPATPHRSQKLLQLADQAFSEYDSDTAKYDNLIPDEFCDYFGKLILRHVSVAGSIAGSDQSADYIQGRRDLVAHIKADFGIDGERHPWICPRCGIDRIGQACPLGYTADSPGECTMIDSVQSSVKTVV